MIPLARTSPTGKLIVEVDGLASDPGVAETYPVPDYASAVG